ncbi:MAG: hypothetical protein IJW20_04125 [Clostridia bacterium]|nr:hypothetical protein [Clostridia bacterium]
MNSTIVLLGIAIACIVIFIYVIKNLKTLSQKLEKYKDNKLIKCIIIFILICLIACFIYYIYGQINGLINNINWYKIAKENDKLYERYDELIAKENKYYNEKINLNYKNQKYNEPYIPEGFTYVEGEWNSGFVIQDSNQNQYVWVPCTNKDNLEIPKLERKIWSTQDFISKDLCNNDEYEEFIKSALENGGFYISRFEIGKENDKPVSKKGVEVWANLNKAEANKIIETMYDNINCDLINGYAYDTALTWITENNEIKANIIDMENSEKTLSGRSAYNNIYDFTDNIMEITSETTYSNVIVRGFPYEISDEIQEYVLDFGYDIEKFDRFSIQEDENFFTVVSKLAFRTIIYK